MADTFWAAVKAEVEGHRKAFEAWLMAENEKAPEGTKDGDPAPPCPFCGGPRSWSDYWTEDFVAICVECIPKA